MAPVCWCRIRDTEAMYVQLKGEKSLKHLEALRKQRRYDDCLAIVTTAHYNYKLLAAITVVRLILFRDIKSVVLPS